MRKVCEFKKDVYLCIAFEEKTSRSDSGCSAVRLAHLLWEQGVVGSNPATPTKKESEFSDSFFLFENIAIFVN